MSRFIERHALIIAVLVLMALPIAVVLLAR